MEINQLEAFLAVAKVEHITQAAEQMHITQPALSKIISRLEDDLGVSLFDRVGKTIRLNPSGQIAKRYAEQILYTIGDMRAELAGLEAGWLGDLRLGSTFPAGDPNPILGTLGEFAQHRPDVSIHLQQYAPHQLRDALEAREIDLAISTVPMLGENIYWHELFRERMGIILSIYHPLAAKSVISLQDLVRERFYCNNANSDVQNLTHVFCERAGFTPNIHFECEFPEFIGRTISIGGGVSIISQRGYLRDQNKANLKDWERNIVFRPLEEDYCSRLCGVAYLTNRHLTKPVQEFYQMLLENHSHKSGPSPSDQ